MKYEYDLLAFIGRFQPFHNGHKVIVDTALQKAKRVVIIIGSADEPRTIRNPWTAQERMQMITSVYANEVAEGRLTFISQVNYRYNDDRWVSEVTAKIHGIAHAKYNPDPVKIGIIGHGKDESSYYLKLFPNFGSVDVPNETKLDATGIRKQLFNPSGEVRGLPENVMYYIRKWQYSFVDDWTFLKAENIFIQNYRKDWRTKAEGGTLAYPPAFVTVDAVVVQSGHILLIQRGAMPGKGQWALPGGFVNPGERLIDAAVRELEEETAIKLSTRTLRGCIEKSRVFDDPNRSLRGRFYTNAFLFRLEPQLKLPKVKGSDDAAKAKWVPLAEVRREQMFEDHFCIISEMTGV